MVKRLRNSNGSTTFGGRVGWVVVATGYMKSVWGVDGCRDGDEGTVELEI